MNMIEKVDLTKAYYLQHLITEHYQECMDEWYKKCKFKKDKEVEMKKVEKYVREVIEAPAGMHLLYVLSLGFLSLTMILSLLSLVDT